MDTTTADTSTRGTLPLGQGVHVEILETNSDVDSPTPAQIELSGALAKRRLHAFIRRWLSKSGMSQSDLAKLLGVNRSRVNRMLSDPSNLSIETAGRVLGALGLWIDFDASRPKRAPLEIVHRQTQSGMNYVHIISPHQKEPTIITSTEHRNASLFLEDHAHGPVAIIGTKHHFNAGRLADMNMQIGGYAEHLRAVNWINALGSRHDAEKKVTTDE